MIIVNCSPGDRDQRSRLYGRQFASIEQWKHEALYVNYVELCTKSLTYTQSFATATRDSFAKLWLDPIFCAKLQQKCTVVHAQERCKEVFGPVANCCAIAVVLVQPDASAFRLI